ncbi:Crp/Fnr family transcriptional regulator [Maribacter flavus]|uniref:Crp/Fnr family transcriptional regulator n=2 Tax=Maribacter flavus TaxID=1658664 RepID=A0A5B2U0P2_9FLAO|nr:Crp/Fnr family transcriptional regulator [Maribacter flavus]
MSASSPAEKNLYIIIFLNSIYPMGNELRSFLSDKIKSCQFRKNEFVVRTGEKCERLYLLKEGMVRGFFNSGGEEITTWVDSENEVFTSITGFFGNKPAMENIQCIEDTYCDYLEYKDYRYCLRRFPEMNHISRMMLEEYYRLSEHRVLLARIPSAKNRLDYFMEHSKKDYAKRIPKKYLASFLAMRPETLSRLLKKYSDN